MVNHCCIQYCKQYNAGLGKKFGLPSDQIIRQSWIEVIEKVIGGKLKNMEDSQMNWTVDISIFQLINVPNGPSSVISCLLLSKTTCVEHPCQPYLKRCLKTFSLV